jgi:hypothetical protein
MDSITMERILLEVAKGVPAPAREPKEHAEVRRKLQIEVDEIRLKGGIVDIPSELP